MTYQYNYGRLSIEEAGVVKVAFGKFSVEDHCV